MQRGVIVLAAGSGSQLHAPMRINPKIVEPDMRAQKRVAGQHLRRVESDRALQQRIIQLRSRLHRDASQSRLLDRIPIVQRRFQIAVEKIERAEKVVGVAVFRIQLQRSTQLTLGSGKIAPLVIHARKLHKKARLPRGLAMSGRKGRARVVPPLRFGES